jgi:D-alanyl-D-alanine carboxypeptidase
MTAAQKSTLASLSVPHISPRTKIDSNPGVSALAYIVLDPDTEYPLAAKNSDMPVPIASTTKIMTAMVVMDSYDLDKVVTIPHEAAAIEGSEIQLMTNETMTVKNLLYGLLLNSGNDAGTALSLIDNDKASFVNKMNAKAQLLGMTNTHYDDPVGLDDTGHSSARDLALLTRYALTNQVFSEIVGTVHYTIWSADKKYKHDLTNTNRLINPVEPYYLPSAIGVKTGNTDGAGHCLVSAIKLKNGKPVVAVVLHTTEDANPASAKESRKLLIWAQNILHDS